MFLGDSQREYAEKVAELLDYSGLQKHGQPRLFNNGAVPMRALDMKCPAQGLHSRHPCQKLAYPFHDRVIHVTNCERICLPPGKKLISARSSQDKPWDQRSRRRYLAGQLYGVRSRLHRSGGKKTLQPLNNPFGAKSVTYVSGTICHLCPSGRDPKLVGGADGIRTQN